jgi:hypothetical protein
MSRYRWELTETVIPANDAFPQGVRVRRAVVPATLEWNGLETDEFPCLLDTGADYCQFPNKFLTDLRLNIADLPCGPVNALLAEVDNVPFATVNLRIPGFAPLSVRAGFTEKLNKENAGLLGIAGALSQFKILLDFQDGFFIVGDD